MDVINPCDISVKIVKLTLDLTNECKKHQAENKKLKDKFEAIEQSTESSAYLEPEIEKLKEENKKLKEEIEKVKSIKKKYVLPFTQSQLDWIAGYTLEHPDEIHDDDYLLNHLRGFLQERDEKEDWINPDDIDKDWCDSWLSQNGDIEEFVDECLESNDEERISQSQAHDLKNFVMEVHNEVAGTTYNDVDIVSAMVLTGKGSLLENVKSKLKKTNP